MNNIMDWLLGGFVNWKTTVTGVATGVLILLSGLGYIHITDAERQTVIGALLILFSWFVKDANQTGKPSDKL